MPMTGKAVLLDTNIVVSHFRDKGVFDQLFTENELYLPQVALAKLYAGAAKSDRPEHHRKLIAAFLPSVTVLASDQDTAKLYGDLWAHLSKAGTMIPQNDIWIAGLAVQYLLLLVSQDEHFELIDNLDLLSW